jgi:hypothetical protein
MPFEIRKKSNGYKVFSIPTNRPLSKKILSKEEAKKQLVAVRIHYKK